MTSQDSIDVKTNSIGISLNRILSKLMEDNQVTLSMLYRNTGIAIPTIKRLQSDPTTNPTLTTLLPIANFFGISLSQLIGIEPLPKGIIGYIENKTSWFKVPLIEWNQVVQWCKHENQIGSDQYVLVDIDVGKNAFALTVKEDDWYAISKDSILIINNELTPDHKDFAIVNKLGQINPTLKQILIDEEKIYLKPMNPHLPPTMFDDSYTFLGVLMQIRKNIKV